MGHTDIHLGPLDLCDRCILLEGETKVFFLIWRELVKRDICIKQLVVYLLSHFSERIGRFDGPHRDAGASKAIDVGIET